MSLKFRILSEVSVVSTNDVAKKLGSEGEPEGLVVIATTQTAGKGRSGNYWASPPGGLYMSILLRPGLRPEKLLSMTVFSCVPVAKAIETKTGIRTGLKWPNDIEADGKKLGGILVEGVSRGGRLDFAVIGIGLNVNADPPEEDAPNSTSIMKISCKRMDPRELFARILNEFETFYEDLERGELRTEYLKRSSVLGKRVELSTEGGVAVGMAKGIGEDGSLTIGTAEGDFEVLSATGVALRTLGGGGAA